MQDICGSSLYTCSILILLQKYLTGIAVGKFCLLIKWKEMNTHGND